MLIVILLSQHIRLSEGENNMTKEKLFEFIKKQKTAFISSVDEEGYPVTRAMLCAKRN